MIKNVEADSRHEWRMVDRYVPIEDKVFKPCFHKNVTCEYRSWGYCEYKEQNWNACIHQEEQAYG